VQRRLINLTFHGIGEPERRLDPGEQDVWVSLRQFLGVLDSVASRDDVQITFDDGNASDVEHALPALRARALTATFFLVAGNVGAPGYVDRRGVEALVEAGMTIGCHGMRHRPWRWLDQGALREELVDARTALEQIARRPVTTAACPFGAYDRRVLTSLRRSGYARVYTSDRGTTRPAAWVQPRNTVAPTDSVPVWDEIARRDASPHGVLRRRAKLMVKRWR
jgi:peptidoglycan/xylan/chitin deacetylase (PgdA/CDA1 family)